MEQETVQWTQSEIEAFSTLYWSRYVSLAALVILLWDHCLTFRQEVEFIWPSRANFVKRAFLVNRYLVPVVLAVNMHTQSGLGAGGLSDNFCKVWTVAVFTLAGFSVAISQWLILLKLWRLWGGRQNIIFSLLFGYLVFQVGCIVLIALTAHEANSIIRFQKTLNMCALTSRPQALPGLYSWLLFFEVVAYTLVCYNALSRPREGNEILLKVLHRDGILFFSVTVALRVLNLIMAFLDIPTQIFLGIYCIWGFVTTTVSRMIINVRAGEIGDNDNTLADDQTCSITSMKLDSQTKGTV